MGVFKKIRGTIENLFQIGLNGAQLKNNGTNILDVRDSSDAAFAQLRILAGTGNNDAITLKQLNTASKPTIMADQADTSGGLPTNTAAIRTLVVTTAGTGAAIGDLLYDDGSSSGSMEILTAVEGSTIVITDALAGGTVTFDPDSIYIWDADGSAWLKIGDIGAVTGAERTVQFDITNAASQSSTFSIPANATVHSVELEIDTPYSASATISIGRTGSTSLLLATTQNDPVGATVGDIFACDQITDWGGSALPVLVTIANTPAAGAGTVVVKFSTPNA